MSGFDNEVLYADNYDFRGQVPVVAQVTAEGQLPIGTGASPAIEVGVLTSPDSSITIGYSNPDITLQAGDAVATTYQAQTGSATPSGNILNVYGIQETSTRASGNTVNVFSPRVARFVVDPTTDRGNYSTIQSAINAASSGETIFVRPGTYTENISGKAGVHLTAFIGDSNAGNVNIVGKISLSSGTMYISGIRITTNGDYALQATSTAGLTCINCTVIVSNNDGILNSGSGVISFNRGQVSISGSGYVFATNSGSGTTQFIYSSIGGSPDNTAGTVSSGSLSFKWCFIGCPITSSSTGVIGVFYSDYNTSSSNATAITTAGTGTSTVQHTGFLTGTASSISSGSGTLVILEHCSFTTSNTNAVTGAGQVRYGILTSYSSSVINPTTTQDSYTYATRLTFDEGSNYLQNFEEGTWTPVLDASGSSPTVGYTTQNGKYTRIGNAVMVNFNVITSSISGGTGNAKITGLPFTTANDGTTVRTGYVSQGVDWTAGYTAPLISIGANSSEFFLAEQGDNVSVTITQIGALASGDDLWGQFIIWV